MSTVYNDMIDLVPRNQPQNFRLKYLSKTSCLNTW